MKPMDFSCRSPASTAICSSMDKHAIVHHRTKPIGRSHLSSPERKKILNTTPCISQLPFDPKSLSNFQRNRKSSAKETEIRRKSSANTSDMASPHRSPRYLLNNNPVFETSGNSNISKVLVPNNKTRGSSVSGSGNYDKPLAFKSSSFRSYSPRVSSSSSLHPKSSSFRSYSPEVISGSPLPLKSPSTLSRARHQVVELMVSIHCKGCEGKIKKHISRMEGVSSFSINMDLKKVTVIGDVTPTEVLTSISRVKNAQFWPSPTSS